jgi:hypothetical protein
MPTSYLGGARQTIGERQTRARRVLGPLSAVDLGPRWQCFCGGTRYVRYRGRFYCPACGHRHDHPDEPGYHDMTFRQAFERAASTDVEGGLADLLRRAEQDRDPAAGLPGIDAVDRILAAAGQRPSRGVPAHLEHVGLAVLLLVNRSVDLPSARPLTRRHWPYIDGYLCTIAERFADVLGQRGQPPRSPYWRGSALAGLRTLLGRHLAVTQDHSRFACELRIADPAGALDQITGLLRRDRVSGVQAGVAFDALVAAYRQLTPRLAGFGQGGEWPADTARLRARLVALVEGTAGPLPIVSGLELWSTQPRGRPRTPR